MDLLMSFDAIEMIMLPSQIQESLFSSPHIHEDFDGDFGPAPSDKSEMH